MRIAADLFKPSDRKRKWEREREGERNPLHWRLGASGSTSGLRTTNRFIVDGIIKFSWFSLFVSCHNKNGRAKESVMIALPAGQTPTSPPSLSSPFLPPSGGVKQRRAYWSNALTMSALHKDREWKGGGGSRCCRECGWMGRHVSARQHHAPGATAATTTITTTTMGERTKIKTKETKKQRGKLWNVGLEINGEVDKTLCKIDLEWDTKL